MIDAEETGQPIVAGLRQQLKAEVAKVIVEQGDAVDLLIAAFLTGGHVLLEGPPGTAKTLLARTFAAATSLDFGRIQFTPDLMPGDVLGMNVFNFATSKFVFTPGPIFAELLLADEINRTPPKTQAALLEAMNERTVTVDGEIRRLSEGFMVIATQNPIEHQGTYPLPEAQLDRFLFKHKIDYPTEESEREVVRRAAIGGTQAQVVQGITAVATVETLRGARAEIARTVLADEVIDYAVALARATREHSALEVGVSPRAAGMMASAARAFAAMEGRDYVVPDDIKGLALPVMEHRVMLTPGAEIDGFTAASAVQDVLTSVEPPR